jgi:hypothetical protein
MREIIARLTPEAVGEVVQRLVARRAQQPHADRRWRLPMGRLRSSIIME